MAKGRTGPFSEHNHSDFLPKGPRCGPSPATKEIQCHHGIYPPGTSTSTVLVMVPGTCTLRGGGRSPRVPRPRVCLSIGTKCGEHPSMLGLLQRALALTRHPAPSKSQPSVLSPFSVHYFSARCMKVVSALKKRCEHCTTVKRGRLTYIYCKVNPRHKQRNGPKRRAGWQRYT